MDIEVQCSSCSKQLRVPEKFAGKKAKCPKCLSIIEIPRATQRPAVSPPPSSTKEATAPPQIPTPVFEHPPTPAIVTADPVQASHGLDATADDNPFSSTPSLKIAQDSKHSGRLILRRLNPLSVATTMAVAYAVFGLLYAFFVLCLALIGLGISSTQSIGGTQNAELLQFGIGGAIALLVIAPLVLSAMGFIGGLIFAAIYNTAAYVTGGVKFETRTQ